MPAAPGRLEGLRKPGIALEPATASAGTGIDKRLHDLRGTAITHLYGLGVDIDDLAAIAGWSAQSVRDVIKLYVGDQALVGRVLAAVRRGNQKLKPALKLVPNLGNEEDEKEP